MNVQNVKFLVLFGLLLVIYVYVEKLYVLVCVLEDVEDQLGVMVLLDCIVLVLKDYILFVGISVQQWVVQCVLDLVWIVCFNFVLVGGGCVLFGIICVLVLVLVVNMIVVDSVIVLVVSSVFVVVVLLMLQVVKIVVVIVDCLCSCCYIVCDGELVWIIVCCYGMLVKVFLLLNGLSGSSVLKLGVVLCVED